MRRITFFDETTRTGYVLPVLSVPPPLKSIIPISLKTDDYDFLDCDTGYYYAYIQPIVEDLEYVHGIHDFLCTENDLFGFTSTEFDDMPAILRDWTKRLEGLGWKIGEPFIESSVEEKQV